MFVEMLRSLSIDSFLINPLTKLHTLSKPYSIIKRGNTLAISLEDTILPYLNYK